MEIRTMSSTDKIIRLKTVLARTGLSRSTVYRKIAEGTFPPPGQNQRSRHRLAGVRGEPLDR
jgi:predicted DNA-binding transcriptional regulator AlpA